MSSPKGNLNFACPPCHLSIGRLTCGLTNIGVLTAGILATDYFSLGEQGRLPVISSSHCFCLFSPGAVPHVAGSVGSCSFSPSSSASEELHYCPISTLAGSILWIGCQQIVIKYKDKLSTVKALCLTLY